MFFQLQIIFGLYPRRCWRKVRNIFWYYRSKKTFLRNPDDEFPVGRNFPCLADVADECGKGRGHYFYQDLIVAQEIFSHNPLKHVDIGSRIDGFVGHVATFRELEVVDIRPLKSDIPHVKFIQADMLQPDKKWDNYCDSLSCLHALEHFGLGRYGDPIDSKGHLKGLENIYRILKSGGRLYFSVPIGEQRVEFNAHRVFSLSWLTNYFQDKYDIISFSFVDDAGNLHQDIPLAGDLISSNAGCHYGCGIFFLKKR